MKVLRFLVVAAVVVLVPDSVLAQMGWGSYRADMDPAIGQGALL